jgi:hypothetical protein
MYPLTYREKDLKKEGENRLKKGRIQAEGA